MLVIKDLHSDISDQFWLFYGYKYIKGNIPFLTLTYHKELENRTIYKYNLTGTDQTMFAVIKLFLGWDWHDFIESPKTKEIAPIIMRATDIETNTEYYLTRKATDIPENVLD